jgi:hypothetical protein
MESARRRERVAAEFRSLFRDEEAHLARFRRIRTAIMVIGIACLLGAWTVAGTPWHWPSATAGLLGLAGGFLLGLAVVYENSLQSWPVIKPLLKDNVLELLGERDEKTQA